MTFLERETLAIHTNKIVKRLRPYNIMSYVNDVRIWDTAVNTLLYPLDSVLDEGMLYPVTEEVLRTSGKARGVQVLKAGKYTS